MGKKYFFPQLILTAPLIEWRVGTSPHSTTTQSQKLWQKTFNCNTLCKSIWLNSSCATYQVESESLTTQHHRTITETKARVAGKNHTNLFGVFKKFPFSHFLLDFLQHNVFFSPISFNCFAWNWFNKILWGVSCKTFWKSDLIKDWQ